MSRSGIQFDLKKLNYNLKTEEGQQNTRKVIIDLYKKLNEVMMIDLGISGISGLGIGTFLFGGFSFWPLGLGIAALDLFIKMMVRDQADKPYQKQLDLLLDIYKENCKAGAEITSNLVFLEVMDSIESYLDKDERREVLFPENFNTFAQYQFISEEFKNILARGPFGRDIVPPPKPEPSIIGKFFPYADSKVVEPVKKLNPEKTSWISYYTAPVWCYLYGHKKAVIPDVKEPNLSQTVISTFKTVSSQTKSLLKSS